MSDQQKNEVTFNLIKSPAYRTAHIDGAFGGITPQGSISFALFSERLAIPNVMVHLLEEGHVGEVVRRESKEGVIRELEISCVVNQSTARVIASWLNERADEIDRLKGDQHVNPTS